MPTYNSELTLKRSIDSIIYQDFDLKKIELIIVDDCSTDDTWSKLNNYQSYNMLADYSLYQTKKNSGPGIARNIGINSAQGDFVVFLDSDDELKSNFFSSIYKTNMLKKEIVYYDGQKTYNNLNFRICKHKKMNNSSLLEKAKSVLNLETDEHVIFAAYSRKLLQTLPKFKAGAYEDVEFSSIAYLKANNIYHLKKKIYIKNLVAGQITEVMTTSKGIQYLGARISLGDQILSMASNFKDETKFFYDSGIRGAVALVLDKMSIFYTSNLDFKNESNQIFCFLRKNIENFDNILTSGTISEKDRKAYQYFISWRDRINE